MRVLVVGDDPQVLTLAYYMSMLNPELEVDVAHTREDKPFVDTILNIRPVHTEKAVESLGVRIQTLRDVNLRNYDLIIDFMTYRIVGDMLNGIRGFNTIETILASQNNVELYVQDGDMRDIDSDMLKFLKSRYEKLKEGTGGSCYVEYGVKHVEEQEHCIYVGYGLEINLGLGIKQRIVDPVYAYRHAIYTAVNFALKLNLDLHSTPYWRTCIFPNHVYVQFGLTSNQVVSTGRMTTSISLTFEDEVYGKLVCLYRKNVIGFQLCSRKDVLRTYATMLYTLSSLEISDYLKRLLFVPSPLQEGGLRTWVDVLIEMLLREMYWLFYKS